RPPRAPPFRCDRPCLLLRPVRIAIPVPSPHPTASSFTLLTLGGSRPAPRRRPAFAAPADPPGRQSSIFSSFSFRRRAQPHDLFTTLPAHWRTEPSCATTDGVPDRIVGPLRYARVQNTWAMPREEER